MIEGTWEGRTAAYTPASPVALSFALSPLSQGRTDPTTRHDADGWWFALRLATGTATLLIRERRDHIDATAWGEAAEEALDAVPGMCGALDDPTGFDPSLHPVVARLHHDHPHLRAARTGRILHYLVPTVLGQKVTGIEQKSAWRQLVTRYGVDAPGPAPHGMKAPPDVATWRRIPSWVWHRAGVGPQRSDTLMRVFAVADSLERAARVSAAEASRRLQSIPGIGPWTAAEVLQRSHGDPDAISVGDYHLCKRVGEALTGQRTDDAGMLAILAPWSGHRQRVVRLLDAGGLGYQRHGARMTIPEHRSR